MEFEKQLHGLMTLQDPGTAFTEKVVVMARARLKGQSKVRSRFIVIGTLVVVAAAAAMLGVWLRPTSKRLANAVPVLLMPSPSEQKAMESGIDIAAIHTPAPVPAAVTIKDAAPLLSPSLQFTVHVRPLQNEAADVLSRGAVDTFHAAFLKELRAVPGLTLIVDDPARGNLDAPVPFQITVRGMGPIPGNHFSVEVLTETRDSDGIGRSSSSSGIVGEISALCGGLPPTEPPSCDDPPGLAAMQVHYLRTKAFPADPSLQQRLQVRLTNQNLDPRERLTALWELGSFGDPAGRKNSVALQDPAVVREVIALATTVTDPLQRAQIWREMRGVRSEILVQPLISAIRQDPDGEVRLQALATLMKDFGTDARARTVFEAAAREDSRPLVRALAQRALGEEEAWKSYVVGSLKDTRRPATERVDALLFHLNLRRTNMGDSYSPEPVKRLMDLMSDDVARAIADVLPKAVVDSSVIKGSAYTLVSELDQIGHPAFTEMLLNSLENGDNWVERSFMVSELARRISEPRVRSALEKVAASDPDPQVRETAAAALSNAKTELSK